MSVLSPMASEEKHCESEKQHTSNSMSTYTVLGFSK